MITPRLRRVEKAVDVLASADCTTCWNGLGPSLIVQHWLREDGTSWEEVWPSEVLDANGHCRRCGRLCPGRIELMLPECIRDGRVARGEPVNGEA